MKLRLIKIEMEKKVSISRKDKYLFKGNDGVKILAILFFHAL